MNAIERLNFAKSVQVIDSGDYEGLPVSGTDVAKLAECIGMTIGSDKFTPDHLAAYKAMMARESANSPKRAATGGNTPKLKWAAFPSDTVTDSATGKTYQRPRLSDEAILLYEEYRAANVKAAEARRAFEQVGTPEIKAAVIAASGKPLPPGKDILVTYKFGRINVAVADAEQVKAAKSDIGNLF